MQRVIRLIALSSLACAPTACIDEGPNHRWSGTQPPASEQPEPAFNPADPHVGAPEFVVRGPLPGVEVDGVDLYRHSSRCTRIAVRVQNLDETARCGLTLNVVLVDDAVAVHTGTEAAHGATLEGPLVAGDCVAPGSAAVMQDTVCLATDGTISADAVEIIFTADASTPAPPVVEVLPAVVEPDAVRFTVRNLITSAVELRAPRAFLMDVDEQVIGDASLDTDVPLPPQGEVELRFPIVEGLPVDAAMLQVSVAID